MNQELVLRKNRHRIFQYQVTFKMAVNQSTCNLVSKDQFGSIRLDLNANWWKLQTG